ncbi:MAG: hypothetical protein Q8R98_11315 [Rubrivivax sp.]|nr:hypothetical protein [Rubrivivax sp.]MDP3612434.1 hypothetical protein [Rubrivivax sp.]
MGRYLTLTRQTQIRAAAARAAGALKRWAATVDAGDLLSHVANEEAPLEWLQRVESMYADQAQQQRVHRDQSDAVRKSDAAGRHQHDSAAMELAGRLEEDARHARSQIDMATRTAKQVEELLRRQGFSADDVQKAAARTTMGLDQWRIQEARDAIVLAETRAADMDRTLASLRGRSAAPSPELVAELEAMRCRHLAEADHHRAQLVGLGDEVRRLESLAKDLHVTGGELSLLAGTIARAQAAVVEVTRRLDLVLSERSELDEFLSDPMRDLAPMSEGLRTRVLELSFAMRHGHRQSTGHPRLP